MSMAMSASPPASRHLAQALSCTFRTQARQARLFSSIRAANDGERLRHESTVRAGRSLFTASYQRNAEAADALPKAANSNSSFNQPPSSTTTTNPAATSRSGTASLTSGLSDLPIKLAEDDPSQVDWTSSFHGLSVEPFSKEAADVLLKPLNPEDVEIKPDGIIYLPEIKYRRILNQAFGPGGWGLAPRGESIVTAKTVTREYALLAHGRLVSIARGEQDYFSPDGIPTATEGCKSNAMMRCCKDLGVASELWDPRFIRKFKSEYTREVFVEHVVSKKKTKIWIRKGDVVPYPFKETKFGN